MSTPFPFHTNHGFRYYARNPSASTVAEVALLTLPAAYQTYVWPSLTPGSLCIPLYTVWARIIPSDMSGGFHYEWTGLFTPAEGMWDASPAAPGPTGYMSFRAPVWRPGRPIDHDEAQFDADVRDRLIRVTDAVTKEWKTSGRPLGQATLSAPALSDVSRPAGRVETIACWSLAVLQGPALRAACPDPLPHDPRDLCTMLKGFRERGDGFPGAPDGYMLYGFDTIPSNVQSIFDVAVTNAFDPDSDSRL